MSVKDRRKAPFIWASIAALDHLRANWSDDAGARPAIGRSVYYALCELANEDHAREQIHENSGRFRTSRKRIVEQAGVSDKPIDKALRELERIGLLHVERTESEGSRPGAISSYTLLEPGETYGASPEVEANQRTELVRTSSGASPEVGSERTELVRTSPYREKKNSKKEKKCENHTPADLPELVEAPLRQAADAKDGHLDPAAVHRACKASPGRDHALEAEKFTAWHLHGNGVNAPLGNVATAFRSWLEKAPVSPPKSDGAVSSSRRIPTEPVVETERAAEAWKTAKQLLSKQMPSSTFQLWFEPLEVAGERVGRLVLVDTSDTGGIGKWVDRRYKPLILEATDAFDDLEIVDQTQLELEAA
jgi:hypothetical protein